MSDRVIFGTINDTVTPANSSGFNGFSFPYSNGPTGTGTARPIKLDFDQAKSFYSRVKNWTFSSTWSSTQGVDTQTFANGIATPGNSNATRELQVWNPGFVKEFATGGSGGVSTLAFAVNPLYGVEYGTSTTPRKLWPSFNLATGFFGQTILRAGTSSLIIFAFDTTQLTAVTGSFVGQINGNNVDIYYDATTFPPDSYVPGTMSFTPSEFWPYAAKDGSPIYNTTTGVQLQDPTN